jgi:hypothetical protein
MNEGCDLSLIPLGTHQMKIIQQLGGSQVGPGRVLPSIHVGYNLHVLFHAGH